MRQKEIDAGRAAAVLLKQLCRRYPGLLDDSKPVEYRDVVADLAKRIRRWRKVWRVE